MRVSMMIVAVLSLLSLPLAAANPPAPKLIAYQRLTDGANAQVEEAFYLDNGEAFFSCRGGCEKGILKLATIKAVSMKTIKTGITAAQAGPITRPPCQSGEASVTTMMFFKKAQPIDMTNPVVDTSKGFEVAEKNRCVDPEEYTELAIVPGLKTAAQNTCFSLAPLFDVMEMMYQMVGSDDGSSAN